MDTVTPESVEVLRERLREAEDTLSAIRSGEVDAVVVTGDDGRSRIYRLRGADWTYRLLIEQMQEGAMILSADGTILYANKRLAAMLERPLENVSGRSVYDVLHTPSPIHLDNLLLLGSSGPLR